MFYKVNFIFNKILNYRMGFFTKRLSTKTLAQELESRGCFCDTSSGTNVYSLGLSFGQFTKKSAMGLSAGKKKYVLK